MAPFSSVLIQNYDHSQWPFALSYDNWEMPQSWARGWFEYSRNPVLEWNLLNVDGVVGLEAGGGDDLVPLDQLPHLLRGQLLGRVLRGSWELRDSPKMLKKCDHLSGCCPLEGAPGRTRPRCAQKSRCSAGWRWFSAIKSSQYFLQCLWMSVLDQQCKFHFSNQSQNPSTFISAISLLHQANS